MDIIEDAFQINQVVDDELGVALLFEVDLAVLQELGDLLEIRQTLAEDMDL